MSTVLTRYQERLALGEIEADAAQRAIAARLDQLQSALEAGCQSVPDVMTFMARRDAVQLTRRLAAGCRGGAKVWGAA